ncbi:MAG: hypothetical protein WCF67_03210 [Chitinophagaceae bacterium]
MKGAITFLCLIIMISIEMKAQETTKSREKKEQDKLAHLGNAGNTKTITVKFNSTNKSFSLLSPPKYVGEGGSIDIVVEDFNPFLFNLTITEKQGIYQSNQTLSDPKTFGPVTFSRSTYDIKDLIINFGKLHLPSSTFSSSTLTDFETEIFKKDAEIRQKNLDIVSKYNQLSTAKNNEDSVKIFEGLNELKTKIGTLTSERQRISDSFDREIKKQKNESDLLLRYTQKVESLLFSFQRINKISSFYRTLVNTSSVDGLAYKFINDRKQNNLASYFPDIDLTKEINISVFFNQILDELQKNYFNLSKYYNEVLESIGNPSNKAALSQNYNELENVYTKINFENYARFIDLIDKIYLSINPDLFTIRYTTRIIDDDADLIYFELNATPVANEQGIPLQPVKVNFSIPIKGGAKIDIASGFSFNFGLYDRKYRYEKQTNGSYRVIKNDNKSLFEPGIVLMAHLYRRNTLSNHRPGLCVGIGVSGAVRYYLGLGWIIGRKQRMNFCAGIVGGQVDYADESVVGKDLFIDEEEITKPIPLQKPAPFRIGGFLGITFNLTGGNLSFSEKATKNK